MYTHYDTIEIEIGEDYIYPEVELEMYQRKSWDEPEITASWDKAKFTDEENAAIQKWAQTIHEDKYYMETLYKAYYKYHNDMSY